MFLLEPLGHFVIHGLVERERARSIDVLNLVVYRCV
jgi:hypothetical protein